MKSQSFIVQTDTATVAVFDMGTLQHRVDDDGDWWTMDVSAEPEVAFGKICIVSVGDDGVHQMRVTTEGLTPDEPLKEGSSSCVSAAGSLLHPTIQTSMMKTITSSNGTVGMHFRLTDSTNRMMCQSPLNMPRS